MFDTAQAYKTDIIYTIPREWLRLQNLNTVHTTVDTRSFSTSDTVTKKSSYSDGYSTSDVTSDTTVETVSTADLLRKYLRLDRAGQKALAAQYGYTTAEVDSLLGKQLILL